MSMAEMTQEEMVQEVLYRVLQSSTGVEDLETVTSLSGVKSLPGEKDGNAKKIKRTKKRAAITPRQRKDR